MTTGAVANMGAGWSTGPYDVAEVLLQPGLPATWLLCEKSVFVQNYCESCFLLFGAKNSQPCACPHVKFSNVHVCSGLQLRFTRPLGAMHCFGH